MNMNNWRFKENKLLIAPLICLCFIVFAYQNISAAESMLDFMRKNIQPGLSLRECQAKFSSHDSVKFNLLQTRETRTHIYELWSVTVLGVPCYRLFVDNDNRKRYRAFGIEIGEA